MIVIEYLEKLYDKYLGKRVDLEQQIGGLEIQLKENQRFISLLEESRDPNFEAFSPRVPNIYQNNKVKELKEEGKNIRSAIDEVKDRFQELNQEIEELEYILQVARETLDVSQDNVSRET